jgi:hypothetical protein
MWASYRKSLQAAFLVVFCLALGLHGHAQSSSVYLSGTILDPTGAVVANAAVEIHNPVSHFDRSTTTDGSGKFSFPNVPFNALRGSGYLEADLSGSKYPAAGARPYLLATHASLELPTPPFSPYFSCLL